MPPNVRFSDNELTMLRQRFDEHKIEQDARMELLAELVASNTRAVASLTESVERIAASTEGVVSLYRDIQGATRLGRDVQGLLTWLVKTGAVGAAVASGVYWMIDHIKP